MDAAFLFADIKSALYAVWPEIAVGLVLSEQQRNDVFTLAGIPADHAVALRQLVLEEDPALRRRTVGDSWRRMAADWDVSTYLLVGGSSVPVGAPGARPEDSLADLVFVLVLHASHKELARALRPSRGSGGGLGAAPPRPLRRRRRRH